jgi:hypothetical protein
LFLPLSVWSGDVWHDCEVKEFYHLNDNGSLKIKSEGYRSKQFKVDWQHNVILGNKINTLYNKDIVSSNPTDKGIYSLVNYSRKDDGQIRRLSFLTVQDYEDNKPFVFVEGNYIMTGLCH